MPPAVAIDRLFIDGFGCPADEANLLEDAICTGLGLNEAWLADLDHAPGLFQVARQIVA
jgi:hypothetical protein